MVFLSLFLTNGIVVFVIFRLKIPNLNWFTYFASLRLNQKIFTWMEERPKWLRIFRNWIGWEWILHGELKYSEIEQKRIFWNCKKVRSLISDFDDCDYSFPILLNWYGIDFTQNANSRGFRMKPFFVCTIIDFETDQAYARNLLLSQSK